MRCLTCQGRGWIENETENRAQFPLIPCPRCKGTGIDHCCDGDIATVEIVEQSVVSDQPSDPGERNSSRT